MLAVLSTLPTLLPFAGPAELPPTEKNIRAAITRSLPFVEKRGMYWIKVRKCVSCHRVSFMTWTFTEASRKGFKVDQKELATWNKWSSDALLKNREDDGKPVGTRNLSGVGQVLFWNDPPAKEQLLKLILSGQRGNGTWQPRGQLPMQKRPKAETTEVMTMWLTVLLSTLKPTDAITTAKSKSLKFIATRKSAKSTEWFAARLVLAGREGTAEEKRKWATQLLSLQNADGGWAWLVGEKSDAIATGQAMYALLETGMRADDKLLRRAQSFLIRTQRKDGSWAVNGTKTKHRDKPQETANYWGTCWATIALLKSLP